jgi:hypothetical protein
LIFSSIFTHVKEIGPLPWQKQQVEAKDEEDKSTVSRDSVRRISSEKYRQIGICGKA